MDTPRICGKGIKKVGAAGTFPLQDTNLIIPYYNILKFRIYPKTV